MTLPARLRYPALGLMLAALALILHWAYSTVYAAQDLGWSYYAARHWLAGVEPYSAEMTRLLRPGDNPETASGFPYPFPVILVMLPLTALPLAWACTIWALAGLAAAAALPWLAAGLRPGARAADMPAVGGAAALPFVYFPLWAAMEQAQWSLLLLAIAVLSLRWHAAGRQRLAGALLPLLLLKPQLGLAALAALAAYQAMRGVDRRWLEGLALGAAVVWGGSLLVEPGWPLGWLVQLRNYTGEGQNSVRGLSAAGALAIPLAAALALLGWRRGQPDLALAGVLLLGMLALPMRSFYNQALFLLPLALMAARRPRAALAAALAGWALFPLAFAGLGESDAAVLALYMPPLALGLAALRGPSPYHQHGNDGGSPSGSEGRDAHSSRA